VSSPTTLICLPFAGAGPLFYRPWQALAAPDLDVFAPPMPGRERLLDQPLPGSVPEAADQVLPAAAERARAAPVVLFGHCFGGLVAFELARRLAETPGARVLRLVISGTAAPRAPRQAVAGLDDNGLVALVEELAGYRHPALRHPEMRSLIMPVLRADLEMAERYAYGSAGPLDVPLTVLRGDRDAFVARAETTGWAAETTVGTEFAELPGDHMYVVDNAAAVLDLVRAAVGRAVPS